MNEGTVKLVPCPDCEGKPNPACKLCGGSGLVAPGTKPSK